MANLVQSAFGSWSDPSSATFGAQPTSGNLLIAIVSERSGGDATSHVVSGAGWVPRVQRTTTQSDSTHRRSFSVHTKIAGAAESTAFTGDDGAGSSKALSIYEYELEAGEDQWTFLEAISDDNGATIDGTAISSGNTSSLIGANKLLIGLTVFKTTGYAYTPTPVFTNGLTIDASEGWAYQQMAHVVASANDATPGVKSTNFSYNLAAQGNSGLGIALLAFQTSNPAANSEPTLDTPNADITFGQGAVGSVDLSGNWSDGDGDTLTYSVSPALPSGVSLDTNTGVLSWNGTQVQAAGATYTFYADDGESGPVAGDAIQITITAPVFGISSVSAGPYYEGTQVTVNFINPAGPVTCSQPAGAIVEDSKDSSTFVFTISDPKSFGDLTSPYNQDITFTLDDGSTQDTFVLQISPDITDDYGPMPVKDGVWTYTVFDPIPVGTPMYVIGDGSVDIATGSFEAGHTYIIYAQDTSTDNAWSNPPLTLIVPGDGSVTLPPVQAPSVNLKRSFNLTLGFL